MFSRVPPQVGDIVTGTELDGVVYDYADVAITGEGDILIQVESRSYPYSYEWIPAPKGTQLIGGETKTFDLR